MRDMRRVMAAAAMICTVAIAKHSGGGSSSTARPTYKHPSEDNNNGEEVIPLPPDRPCITWEVEEDYDDRVCAWQWHEWEEYCQV